ncbi:MAG: geranylgeranylglycerol-phosphate geranylgeranyltransferase [Marinilabiliaceae bacterium]|nr:geranylgeranylglycerol-phosphate geranylgeranyltransferase [Marinilabiliaceae bacterium]
MIFLQLVRYKNLFIIALLQVLLRYAMLLPILSHYGIEPVLSDLRFGLVVLSTLLLAASGYVINDYFDIRIDRINRPDSVIVGKHIKRRTALFLHVLLTVTGVFIGLFLAYVTRKENYALMYVFIPALLWYYSTTFKRHAVIGNLIISMLTALVPYVVVSIEFAMLARVHGDNILQTNACSTAWFWTSGFAFFAFITNLIREIIKDTEDLRGDKAVGCRTLPIAIGVNYTKILVSLLVLGSFVTLWLIFFFIPEVQNIPYVAPYFVIGLSVPYLLLLFQLYRSQSSKGFHTASSISKVIMLLGIVFILFAGKAF